MKIAQQLKEKNIAEYLIYMWQVEDLLRANGCDIDRIRQNIILSLSGGGTACVGRMVWKSGRYDACGRRTEKGHLQITGMSF